MLSHEPDGQFIAPAATTRRISHLKLLTAVLLVVALSAVLALFGFMVARADARFELERVDALLERRVAEGVEAVHVVGDGTLVVRPTARAGIDTGYPELYVVTTAEPTGSSPLLVRPDVPRWPDVDVSAVATMATDGTTRSSARSAARDPQPAEALRILAVPVQAEDGERVGVVVGVASRASGQASTEKLVSYMWRLAVGLILVSAVVSVLLSRGRWWGPDLVLSRHRQFVAYTAHELRSRVGAMSTIVEAGLAGAEAPERTLERVSAIVDSTGETINDLVTLANLETGRERLRAEPVRLDALVESLVDSRAHEPAIRLDTSPTIVTANVELVRRAVDNLIDNAVRHGRVEDPAAPVTVTVRDGYVEVADRGPGVRPQVITYLVERLPRHGRPTNGGGLGLTIAASVARVHGGELQATNRPGGGAVFTLQLPQTDELVRT